MKLEIREIVVGKRIRKDIGDITLLKESIRSYGLLNPILINDKNELIAGVRRLTACKALGFKEVDVRVVNPQTNLERLLMESEENLLRKEFNVEELLLLAREKEKLLSGGYAARCRRSLASLVLSIRKIFRKLINIFSGKSSKEQQ